MFIPFKNKTYYLAGPMSGLPQFNYPKFHRLAATLRDYGFTIISPAEQDSKDMQVAAMSSTDGLVDGKKPVDSATVVFQGETWGDVMARDVKLIFEKCDGVIAMDDWYKSKGARLEVFISRLLGKPTYVVTESEYGVKVDSMTVGDFEHGTVKGTPYYHVYEYGLQGINQLGHLGGQAYRVG